MNECVIEEIKMKHLEENYDIVVVGEVVDRREWTLEIR